MRARARARNSSPPLYRCSDLERAQVIGSDRRRVATRQRRRFDFADRPPDVHEREAPAGRIDAVERRLVQSVVRLRRFGKLREAARRRRGGIIAMHDSGGRLDVAAALELAARGLALLAADVVVERPTVAPGQCSATKASHIL